MRTHYLNAILKTVTFVLGLLFLGAGVVSAQQQINVTAGPSTAILPDGTPVPMWGYSCGAAVTTNAAPVATCAALNPNSNGGWAPIVITVPTGQDLQINLTNNLPIPPGATKGIPTSLTIVGQLGGGLGDPTQRTTAPSPTHNSQVVTWSTVGSTAAFTPPPQPDRVQSFSTEVATGATTSLTWKAPNPGTYLIESGTHPSIQGPMGLYGVLVVTTAPTAGTAGTAYPANNLGSTAVSYNAEIPLLFSEIDPVQNTSVGAAVNTANFSETLVWSGQPGGCGNTTSPTYHQCYPPAVNYTPLYYMINGVAFNKTNAPASLFAAVSGTAASPITGNLLVRLVNAGLRMHVPSIVGSQTGAAPVGGFSLIAEDGNLLPGTPRVQNEVFMAAGKTYDVMIKVPASTSSALPIYDRELSLSGNAINRDAGMLAYIGINGSTIPTSSIPALSAAKANPDAYNSLVPGKTFNVSDPSKGVIANDTNVYGVQLDVTKLAANGTVTLNPNGTFTYVPSGTATSDTFGYCGNGTTSGPACSTVTLGAAAIEAQSGIIVKPITYTANTSTYISIKTPGVLSVDKDTAGFPLTVDATTVTPVSGLNVVADLNGGFTATVSGPPGPYTFTYQAQNSQGTHSSAATVTLIFPAPSNLKVSVLDGADKTTLIKDYRWVIEEDRTFYNDPKCATNPPATGCLTAGSGIVPILGVNFHTSYMPFVAQGCTGPLSCEGGQMQVQADGSHKNVVCDVGNGACRLDATGNGFAAVMPSSVHLDPTKRYYISVLPGDAATPFGSSYTSAPTSCSTTAATNTPGTSTSCGHGMGGAPLAAGQSSVTILTQPSPFPPAKLSVFVFEDDFPLNGEQDSGGGTGGVNTNNEPGLGQFQLHLWDAMGGNGDFTGQMTYDMFNQPLTNSLDGTIDPTTSMNACPITKQGQGITGMIVTCPEYEADGVTPSPLAGQAVINNLMPGRWGVVATPAADRIARGEEWLQTNTLDGQKAHDVFTRIGEPAFFQEFGPAGYHVSIGFANPAIINARHVGVCNGTDPNLPAQNCFTANTITGRVVGERLSRTPDERLYGSGSHDAFYWTQCFVSFGDPDGEDFAFTKCDANGNFTLSDLPDGDWRVTTFDQWNDQLVDGLSTPVRLDHTKPNTGKMGDIAGTQWQTNLYTRTFVDDNKDGSSQSSEAGIPFANVAVRLRDGSLENLLLTDFTGTANFNESFPLFAWYTVETDTTRYKNTGTHIVYDAGGPADGTLTTCGGTVTGTGYPPCGTSVIGKYLANTVEQVSVPTNLRVPGAIYCAVADCTNKSIQNGPGTSDPPSVCTTATTTPFATTCSTKLSTGRIDPPWVGVEGWQGFPGQNNFIEFGKEPYAPGENGGIKGHVIYASTRPFDDPMMLVQTQWEPLVPHVTINLYQEGVAADGVTPTRTLVDTTQTSSFDDWAQGFRPDGTPNMSCPGQGASTGADPDLFFFSLFNQPDFLDLYNSLHNGGALHSLPNNSQFKCYDGMHNWNQIQPAPYDGMYQFPSVASSDPVTGKPNATNCSICSPNTFVPTTDLYYGLPMLPKGKYVVEVVVPPGFELVKEEDKNILIGDNFIAPVTQEFGGLGNVFILPDQASVASAYNANNAQNPTQGFGTTPQNGIVPGFVPEPVWPCVGETRIVPDYISLYPQTHQVSPFAGATRNLCDRKEVTLNDQMGAIAKFYVYTSTHIASKFTGGITDDYTSEFDPFSPQFGEKFAPPNLPVSVKDWAGNEISRVYADQWGAYDGVTYSTWEVNPPNPTGYSPTMMVFCMNDPGPIADPSGSGAQITDPAFTQGYSQFCYELPFMPGTTQYLDTPVVPTSAFAGAGYNNVDCAYPDATPAVSEVDGDGVGPWVLSFGNTLTITSLGTQVVPNYAYSGPSATTPPFNSKTLTRHYGFGTSKGTVTIGGISVPPASITTWNDTTIALAVPSGVPACAIQQQAQYTGSTAYCGQLVITRADNGKQSIDAVTVTIGGKAPTHVPASGTIQSAIDMAAPGDLIIVDPTCTASTGPVACTTPGAFPTTQAAHNEMLIMWKPVRLQGVGAATSIINANTHPAGKLETWRQQIDCLFGLALNGQPVTGGNQFDPTGAASCPGNGNWKYFTPTANNPQVDRLPLEAALGWDAELNGNLAELLQEPSLMGALEGAGITVLGKGVNFPSNPWLTSLLAGFPTGTLLLQNVPGTAAVDHCSDAQNPFPSNFECNPSSIDGLGITNSSQGGGGIFMHGWGHNLEIANNRIYNNAGTLSGGINVGQGEFAPPYLQGSATNAAPGSCLNDPTVPANQVLPYCQNLNVKIHNNYVSLNSSTGDELFSATPAGAGGVSICTGADNYKFNYNWVCGNLSSGDGGGLGHMGFSYNGDIEHNTIIFNQSLNPTIPANGGGIIVMGAPDQDLICNNNINLDTDCAPPSTASGILAQGIGPSDGTGPNLVINANMIMGNSAEAGSGGGIAFQNVNGSDVVSFPTTPANWNSVLVTNNIIADNVAGWDGAGISLMDALNVTIQNNTIAANASTGSAGILFTTIGAPLASSSGANCTTSATTSCPQVGGVVAIQNSSILTANMASTITCPPGHYAGSTANNGTCRTVSYPQLSNDIIFQNSSYYIGVGALSAQFQQNVVSLYNAFTTTLAPSQPQADATTANGAGFTITGGTGACAAPSASSYWDIGVRGDTGPGNHNSNVTLAPTYSVMTSTSGYTGTGLNNVQGNPNFVSQYCDGSRTPPEFGKSGWAVPPGISDATVPNPIFNLTPVATVDEGNNWINLRWGPLSMYNPVTNTLLGNYAPAYSGPGSNPAVGFIPTSVAYPAKDFFGNPRPDPANTTMIDAGAIEVNTAASAGPVASITGGPLAFGNVQTGTPSASLQLTLHSTGSTAVTGIIVTPPSSPFSQPAGAAGGTCGTSLASLAAGSTCTINIVYTPTAVGASAGLLTISASNAGVSGSPVILSGTGTVPAPTITTTSLPNGTQNAAYSTTLTATGGTLPYAWSITTGTLPVGLTLTPGTGLISGTPTGSGTSNFTIQVKDANAQTATLLLSITINPAGGGSITPVQQTSVAGSGVPSLSSTFTGANAAGNMILVFVRASSNTTLSGIADTANNTYNLAVTRAQTSDGHQIYLYYARNIKAAAANTNRVTATFSGNNNHPFLAIYEYSGLNTLDRTASAMSTGTTPNSGPTALTTSANELVFAGFGLPSSYTGTETAGTNFALLQRNNSGSPAVNESRTVTATGTYSGTMTLGSSASWSALVATFTLNSSSGGPAVTTTSVPNGTLNAAYATALVASGGTTPYTWSVLSGTLPVGLSIAPTTGVISGTPTADSTSNFTVQVRDANGLTGTQPLTITVTGIGITTTSLPNGVQTIAYTTTLTATGGTLPYAWSVLSGTLPPGLGLNPSTGAISGTPTGFGPSTFTVQVMDATSLSATKLLSMTVAGPPTVTTTSLPNGTLNVAYTTTLAATGGVTPYTWSVSVGPLPAGLTLNAGTGVISGTPTGTGTTSFTVQVKDANTLTGTQALSLTVPVPPPTVSTTSLPNATQTGAYTTTLTATGGTTPFTWSITLGTLPAGLTLNTSTGAISGTSTGAAGTSNFTVQVQDVNTLTGSKALSLTVVAPPTVSTTSLPNATQTVAYTTTLTAAGGVTPYTWSVTVGTLPAGLTLNAGTGAISGTPTAPGTSNFTVQVKDANAVAATQALSLTVIAAPPTVTTTSLPNATQTVAYTTTLAAAGGTTPYTWSVTVGTLPTGLTLNTSTGAISGTATGAAGTSTFTVQVQDANLLTASKALSLTVVVPPSITTASLPNGILNVAYTTTLVASGGTAPYTWSISVGSLPTGLTLNTATGAISGTPTGAAATTNFTVQVTDANAVTATKALSITINPAKAFVQAANNFSLSTAPAQTSIPVNIATTAGHLLVAFVREGSNATDNFTISDSGANTWTQTTSGYVSAGSSHRAAMFYSFTTNADTSVTAHFTTAGGVRPITITVMEFSGLTAADGSVNSSSASASTLTSGTLTTTSSDVLIYAGGAGANQTSWTAGAGFAIPTNGSNTRSGMEYQIVAAPFSGTTTITDAPGGASLVGVFAGFK